MWSFFKMFLQDYMIHVHCKKVFMQLSGLNLSFQIKLT